MTTGFDIISGGTQPELATAVAKILGAALLPVELKKFPDGERYARLEQTVRNRDLFIFQSCAEIANIKTANTENKKSYSLNDALMETLVIIDAARRASAREISVVLPLFPYARQDRKARLREPISAGLVLQMLKTAGADRIITIDLHSTQIQAAFPGPFENLSARELLIGELKSRVEKDKNSVIIAPDAGSVKNSSKFAKELNIPIIFLPKSRDELDSSQIHRPDFNEDLSSKTCFIIDDMVDTGGTIISAATQLKNQGAKSVIVCATHGLLSSNATEKIKNSPIDTLIVTDSIPQTSHQAILQEKLKVLSTAPTLATAIRSISTGDNIADVD